MTNVVAIIQARMGSSRLPGKTVMELAGRPLLAHVIDRAAATPGVDGVVVATTDQPEDEQLRSIVTAAGAAFFTGSADDVLGRFAGAAASVDADVLVRVTADDPFKDPRVMGTVVDRFSEGDVDYASNTIRPTYPLGIDVEVFSRDALDRAAREAREPHQREHVTPFLLEHPERFRLASVERSPDLSHLRWTIDYPEDLVFARSVYDRLYDGSIFGMDEVLALVVGD
jgi:spore coat polysaccharide biosynthesis protein SpsF (cytidylyltransferase family)